MQPGDSGRCGGRGSPCRVLRAPSEEEQEKYRQAGLNCTLTDAARQSLFPGWDGPLPMLAEVDAQLYIRCERAADLSGEGWWMGAGFRYGGGNGNGNGYGNGTGNGRTRRLRLWQDGGNCCMDLGLCRNGTCWLLDSVEDGTL